MPDLARGLSIVPGRRMRRSLGRCEPATGTIRLHPQLYDERVELFREVLCHEVAHVAVHRLHGRRAKPHGAEWAALMHSVGFAPRATVDVGTLSKTLQRASRPRYAYLHRCPTCDARHRAGRVVRTWRCRKCHDAGRGGKLEIIRMTVSDA